MPVDDDAVGLAASPPNVLRHDYWVNWTSSSCPILHAIFLCFESLLVIVGTLFESLVVLPPFSHSRGAYSSVLFCSRAHPCDAADAQAPPSLVLSFPSPACPVRSAFLHVAVSLTSELLYFSPRSLKSFLHTSLLPFSLPRSISSWHHAPHELVASYPLRTVCGRYRDSAGLLVRRRIVDNRQSQRLSEHERLFQLPLPIDLVAFQRLVQLGFSSICSACFLTESAPQKHDLRGRTVVSLEGDLVRGRPRGGVDIVADEAKCSPVVWVVGRARSSGRVRVARRWRGVVTILRKLLGTTESRQQDRLDPESPTHGPCPTPRVLRYLPLFLVYFANSLRR